MLPEDVRAWFEAALGSGDPASAIEDLARALKSEGMGQVSLYRRFVEFQVALDGADPLYEAVVDVLDLIWGGPRAKRRALYEHELSDEDLA